MAKEGKLDKFFDNAYPPPLPFFSPVSPKPRCPATLRLQGLLGSLGLMGNK